jgi:hypothetical protein
VAPLYEVRDRELLVHRGDQDRELRGSRGRRDTRWVSAWFASGKSETRLDCVVDAGYVRLVVLWCRQLATSALSVYHVAASAFVWRSVQPGRVLENC